MTTQLKFTADDNLEKRLENERDRRKSKTLAKTVRELTIERLTQIESAPATAREDGKEQAAPSLAR